MALVSATTITTTYITCPRDPAQSLGIKLPCIVLVVKNVRARQRWPGDRADTWLCLAQLGQPFLFEAQVLDDKGVRRRFRISNQQSSTRVKPFITFAPLTLDAGWNRVRLDLEEYTRKAYGSGLVEVVRVQIHACCHIRHVYFCTREFKSSALPKGLRDVKKRRG